MASVCDLDLRDPVFLVDPYPTFARLRLETPFAWHEPTGMWMAFRHADANAVLRSRSLGRIWHDREPLERFAPFNLLHRHALLEMEPPDHTRVRRLITAAFTRGHVERLRPMIEAVAHGLIDAVCETGEMDLLADYAEHLPVIVIADLLGVPETDRAPLRPWSNAIVKMYEYERTAAVEDAAIHACEEFADYLRDLIAARRQTPREDLISDLVQVTEDGTRLSEPELIATAILLLNAGHEATVNVIGNGFHALLDRPEELRRLVANPGLVETTVEEMTRFDAPLQLFERTATEDVIIASQRIGAGERVGALLGAANRDPEVFSAPNRFDAARSPNPHIGFGAGIHFCIGAPLARVELQAGVRALVTRLEGIELTEAPRVRPNFVIRGRESVNVRFRPSRPRPR